MRNPFRRRWEIVAVWPDAEGPEETTTGPVYWTGPGARRFLRFAKEAVLRRASIRGVEPPRLEVRRVP